MPVFSLDNGRLSPVRSSLSHNDEVVRETLMAVRDQVVELIYRPVFPVAWLTETSRGPGRHTSLVALDPSSRTVTIDVVENLDTSVLMASLARASRHEEIPSAALSGLYPRGVAAFRKDWQEFLDACPTGLEDHPRLILLAVRVEDEVRAALDTLVGASIEVHRIDLHDSRTGVLVSLEQVRPHEASFLAIGRAVRRGELTAPSSDSTGTADSSQSPALPSPGSGGTPSDPAEAAEQAADGVVFVSRVSATTAEEIEPADTAIPARQPFSGDTDSAPMPRQASEGTLADEADSSAETDSATDLAAPAADEPEDKANDSQGVPSPTQTQSDAVGSPDTGESDPGPEAEGDVAGGRTILSEDAIFAESLGRPPSRHRSAHASSEEFSFRSVGFSADGSTVEASDDLGSVAWPTRETELQKIVARHGEQRLTFRSLRRRVNASAVLDASGEIVLQNGERFTDPTEAASAVAGRQMDGWKNWRTHEGRRLGELRS